MRRFLCWLRGHPAVVCYIETFSGKVWHTAMGCKCGRRRPTFPGGAVKAFHEAYADYPTEWTDIY